MADKLSLLLGSWGLLLKAGWQPAACLASTAIRPDCTCPQCMPPSPLWRDDWGILTLPHLLPCRHTAIRLPACPAQSFLQEDDEDIHEEGLDSLTEDELRQACRWAGKLVGGWVGGRLSLWLSGSAVLCVLGYGRRHHGF